MKKSINNTMGILVHIYDYLHGGYFSSHHQLQYYNTEIYQLYIKNCKEKLLTIYNQLKSTIPENIASIIESSPGIRYFCCDSCHDAKIKTAYQEKDQLVIEIDTDGMLGCLNIANSVCKIKIKTLSSSTCEDLVHDIQNFKRVFWISSDIAFKEDLINFTLTFEAYNDGYGNEINYEFAIYDIEIE